MDVFDFLNLVNTNSIDSIITDPPYQSLERHRAQGTTVRLKNWFNVIPNDVFPKLFQEFYRVLKNDNHLYVMCDAETMFIIKSMGQTAGFRFWKPLVIDLKSIGMGYHYRGRASYILFFEKGKRRLNNLGISDIIEAKRIRGKYPTEKPVIVSETLIKQSTNEGAIVLDPFMGSGSTGEAALKLNRHFLGNDLSEKSINIARERLSKFDKENKI